MSTNLDQVPLCEACGKKPATSFAYFDENPPGKRWLFCCKCNDEKQDEYLPIDSFLSSTGQMLEGLVQLQRKSWMKWPEFMSMLARYHEQRHAPVAAAT